jgi:DNA-binding HxlR family transcriptional regulator
MPEQSNQCAHLCLCPLEGIIDTIGKKWILLVINALGNHGRLRFNQMMNELDAISPTTLTETLKELQKEKLIKRESFSEIPPRVEYYLTKDGAELRKAMLPLLEWASRRNPTTSRKCSTIYKKMQSHQIKRI